MSRFQPTPAYRIILQLLVRERQTRNVTQDELAGRLELSPAQVAKFESGQRQLNFVQTREWCLALGVSFLDFMIDLDADLATAELLNGDDEPDASAPESEPTEGGAK